MPTTESNSRNSCIIALTAINNKNSSNQKIVSFYHLLNILGTMKDQQMKIFMANISKNNRDEGVYQGDYAIDDQQ